MVWTLRYNLALDACKQKAENKPFWPGADSPSLDMLLVLNLYSTKEGIDFRDGSGESFSYTRSGDTYTNPTYPGMVIRAKTMIESTNLWAAETGLNFDSTFPWDGKSMPKGVNLPAASAFAGSGATASSSSKTASASEAGSASSSMAGSASSFRAPSSSKAGPSGLASRGGALSPLQDIVEEAESPAPKAARRRGAEKESVLDDSDGEFFAEAPARRRGVATLPDDLDEEEVAKAPAQRRGTTRLPADSDEEEHGPPGLPKSPAKSPAKKRAPASGPAATPAVTGASGLVVALRT